MSTTIAQEYYGVNCVVFTTGDALSGREKLARDHGFDMVPPTDISIDDDTELDGFSRFTYDSFGNSYKEIIDNLVSANDKIVYTHPITEVECEANKEQEEYLRKYYKNDIAVKLKGLKEAPKTPKIMKEVVGEPISVAPPVVTSQLTHAAAKPKAVAPKQNVPDVSHMHIPDRGFIQQPTPEKPLVVTVDSPEVMVSPLAAVVNASLNSPAPTAPQQTAPLAAATEAIAQQQAVQQPQPSLVAIPAAQQQMIPEQVATQDALPIATDMISSSDDPHAIFPFLNDLDFKICAGGKFVVLYEWASGLLKVNVSSIEDPNTTLDNYSLTLDLAGYIVGPSAKWWPGVKHEDGPVDFKKAYKYDLNAIGIYLAGEEIPTKYVYFNDEVGKLNKLFDLRSVFTFDGVTDAVAQDIFKKAKDVFGKLSTRLTKDYPNARFTMVKYTNKDSFELEASPQVYAYIGGPSANPEGTAAKIQVAGNKQPKLFK